MKILMLNGARKLIGEAAHTLELTEELNSRGYDVRLVLRADCVLLEKAQARQLPIAMTLKTGGKFHPIHSPAELLALRRLILKFKPQIIHCHRGNDHGLATAVINTLPRRERPGIVRTRHRAVPVKNTVPNRWLYLMNADGIMAVSNCAAKSFRDMLPLIDDKLTVIYSAVDTERFLPSKRSSQWRQAHGVQDDELLVGLIARFQRVKGQRPFMEAAAKILEKFPNARFLIAGAGSDPHRQKLLRYAEECGIVDRLILESWLDDIHTATASLDVGVLASLGSEASSRIVYEYLASGVPVVATSVGCIPEVLGTKDVGGVVVPPGDPKAMAEAVCRLLSSADLRDDMGRRARAYAEQTHSRQRWVSAIKNAYEQALKRHTYEITQRAHSSAYRQVLTGRSKQSPQKP